MIKIRILFVIIAILVIIIAASIYGYYILKKYSDSIYTLLDKLESDVENNNWDQVRETKEKLRAKWDQAQAFFPIMVDHAEFHDLGISLSRLFTMLDIEGDKNILPELSVAKKLIRQIPDQEKLTLRNIF